MQIKYIIFFALFAAAGCVSSEYEDTPYQRQTPQTAKEINFAKQILAHVQVKSFAENREYCGYIGSDDFGKLTATKAVKGKKSSCEVKDMQAGFPILASYHTHGAFHKNYDTEIPSSDDIFSDTEEGIDGYVATPGGRIWYINGQRQTAVLICGANCVPSDPKL